MKIAKIKIDPKTLIKNLALVILGSVIIAFGVAVFILPMNLVVGGMSGLGLVLDKIIPVKFLTVDVIIFIMTWFFFFLGLIVLGREFALKTLVSSIVYPPMLSLFLKMTSTDVFGGFFMLDPESGLHLVVSALFGGVAVGTGCALTYIGGGSSGGTDIPAFIITKIFKRVKSSVALGIIDGLIVFCGIFVIKDFVHTLLGVVTVFVTTTVIDKVFFGTKKAFVAQIITEKHELISAEVIGVMHRTTTVTDVVGGYSGKKMKMVIVSFSMHQYGELLRIINNVDKNAFVTIHRAHEINGAGWTYQLHD